MKMFNLIFYVSNYVFLMTTDRETSYKEQGNPVTVQVHEYSRLALFIVSFVNMNSELQVIATCLSPTRVNA
jgi:hypothetical protein